MTGAVRVALVVVGDELLSGARADGNGPWLARRLTREGARVVGLEITGDAVAAVAEACRRAARLAHVVLVSGGLGPTEDDGTRAGIAEAFDLALREDETALAQVKAAQEARGFALDDRRRREALLPEGAVPLANPDGTAPGIELGLEGQAVAKVLWALPGVPREVRRMFEVEVVPRLRALEGLHPPVVASFRVAGVREPDVAETLLDLADDGAFDLGLYPHEGELEVRLTAKASSGADALAAAVEEARSRLAPVYEDVGIEQHVVESLLARRLTVTTAESMTGGLIARMLTSVPGASAVFHGGWVTYSDAWKAKALGVDQALLASEGAVSEAVARAMAEGARDEAFVDVALAVTGIAGPGDGEGPDGSRIPSGTCFFALAYRQQPTTVRRLLAPYERTTVQRRAAVGALDLLRRALDSDAPGRSVG